MAWVEQVGQQRWRVRFRDGIVEAVRQRHPPVLHKPQHSHGHGRLRDTPMCQLPAASIGRRVSTSATPPADCQWPPSSTTLGDRAGRKNNFDMAAGAQDRRGRGRVDDGRSAGRLGERADRCWSTTVTADREALTSRRDSRRCVLAVCAVAEVRDGGVNWTVSKRCANAMRRKAAVQGNLAGRVETRKVSIGWSPPALPPT